MTNTKPDTRIHPVDAELADFLEGTLSDDQKKRIEDHIASCDGCLAKIVSAYESAALFNEHLKSKKKIGEIMKRLNIYLILAIVSFVLSFLVPRHFLQLLVATLLLGTKWIVDSKTTKMLITIYEAWKTGDAKEASRIIEKIDSKNNGRF